MKKMYRLADPWEDVRGLFELTEKEATLVSLIINQIMKEEQWDFSEAEDIIFYKTEE